MESSYGIGVRNRYEIFCDDEVQDPFEILRQQEEENVKRKTDKVKDKTKHGAGKGPKQVSITSASKKVVETVTQLVPDKSARGNKSRLVSHSEKGVRFRQPKDVDIEDHRSRRNRDEHTEGGFSSSENRTESWDSDARKARAAPRGGGRGGRGGIGRSRSGADGFDTRGKREFDRQSGSDKSGVKPVEKREGGGAHNWGRVKDDISATGEYNVEGGERSGDEVVTENLEMKEEVTCETVIEKEREMTLDEWKKQQKTNRSRPMYNLRKPGEGEDGTQWKKLYVLKKKAEDEDDEDDISDEDEFVKRGRQKQHVDIEIKFRDGQARMRGKGRGGRGSFNNARGPGENVARLPPETDAHLPQNAPKVDDWNDFPSLIAA